MLLFELDSAQRAGQLPLRMPDVSTRFPRVDLAKCIVEQPIVVALIPIRRLVRRAISVLKCNIPRTSMRVPWLQSIRVDEMVHVRKALLHGVHPWAVCTHARTMICVCRGVGQVKGTDS